MACVPRRAESRVRPSRPVPRLRLAVRRRLAVVAERAPALLASSGDAGMPQVDVNLCRAFAARRFADQEGLDRQRQRAVARIPAPLIEEQILTILEPEQRERRETAAIEVAPEQDREFILHPPEFARHGQASHDRVAELSRRARANPKLAMILAVEHRVLGHGWATFSPLPGVTSGPSNARLDGSADKSPRVRWRS